MAKSVARQGDYCAEATPHFCIEGSNNVFVNGYSICRSSDKWSEDKRAVQGSKTVFANGIGVARLGDSVSCGSKIASGSLNVFAAG